MSVGRNHPQSLVLNEDDPTGDGSLTLTKDPSGAVEFRVDQASAGAVTFKLADILVALSWLADAAGVERYVPDAAELGATGHQVDGDWENDPTGAGDEDDDEDDVRVLDVLVDEGIVRWIPDVICGARDPITDLPCLLGPEHDGHLHRHLGTVWPTGELGATGHPGSAGG